MTIRVQHLFLSESDNSKRGKEYFYEVFQDYGRNIAFTCGLALQQEFDWLVNLPKEKILKKSNNAEIVFEEQDFDGFLCRLEEYPDMDNWEK